MKFITAVAFAVLIASPAIAQTPEKTVILTVTEADLAVISEGLNELPAKRVNQLFVKLNDQIKAQAAPTPKDPPKESAKPKP